MKDIYIAFLASNYISGRMIRAITRAKYSHVALSESADLREMFSFARRYVNTPLVAGFVRELPSRYLYDGKRTQVKVCKIQLSDEEYEQCMATIAEFRAMSERMKYNYFSIVAYPLHRQVRVRNAYMCIDFVRYALGMDGFCTISELEQHLAEAVVFEGDLRELAVPQELTDDYFEKKSIFYQLHHCAADMISLIKNALFF